MTHLFNKLFGGGFSDVRSRFSSPAALLDALCREEREAIEWVQLRTFQHLRRTGGGLSVEEQKDVVAEAAWVLLRKVRAGDFELRGISPTAFSIQAANWLRLGVQRQKQRLTPFEESEWAAADADFRVQKERADWVEKALEKLPEDCQALLRWRYFEEKPDKELLAEGLTRFQTMPSLANRRCKCLDLMEIELRKLDETAF